MLFQGQEFEEEDVKEAYDEAMKDFDSFGIKHLSFKDWMQYNNDYTKNPEKAREKWIK